MRSEIEQMVVNEMRSLREMLAEMVEDLDVALVGKIPDNFPDTAMVNQVKLYQKMSSTLAMTQLLTMGTAVMMNDAGMTDRHRRMMNRES